MGGVGYFFQQLSGDSGGRLGDFKSRVIGIGPQIGYIFPVGNMQGYLNLKGYKEFDEEHRAAGWNACGSLCDFTRHPIVAPADNSADP